MPRSFFSRRSFFVSAFLALFFFVPMHTAHAAVCTINAETVPPAIDQAYVDANSCSSIEIADSVSTTWVGTVDMGGGTVTVLSGNTMTMGSSSVMTLGLNDDFVVQANATTTQTVSDPVGVQINARNVQISGAISVTELGCLGGFYTAGYGPNLSTGICELSGPGAGAQNMGGPYGGAGQGGAYGGRGAALNTMVFGDSFDPTFLGAGGGADNIWALTGGTGGGRVQIHASGLLSIDGTITANGGAGSNYSWDQAGGGSGGSISLQSDTLSGAGLVEANGGNGYGGVAGGGGRIKVLYNTLGAFDLSRISANGGTPISLTDASARNGTVYILDRVVDDGAGTLTLNSGFDFPVSGDYVRDAVHFGDGAYFSCPTSTNITISSNAQINLQNTVWECSNPVDVFSLSSSVGLSTTNTMLTFSAASSVLITAPAWTNVTTTIAVTQIGSSSTIDIASDLTLHDFSYTGAAPGVLSSRGGFLTILQPITLSLVSSTINANVEAVQLADFSMDAASVIDASTRGCRGGFGGNGYGPDAVTGICSLDGPGAGILAVTGGGAAYGGAGGGSVEIRGTVFGTLGGSTDFGAGGGGGITEYIGYMDGGMGGGVVHIAAADTASLYGVIRANGGLGTTYRYGVGGSGSGGAIHISSNILNLTGTIQANGGNYTPDMYGGDSYAGGGGRIALLYSIAGTMDLSGVVANAGSQPAAWSGFASNGTIDTLDQYPNAPSSLGPTGLVDGSTTSTNVPVFTFDLSDPDPSDYVQYQIQIDDSADFSSPVVSYISGLASQGAASFQVGQGVGMGGSYTIGSEGQSLADGSYYWRVLTRDSYAAPSSYLTAHSGAVAFTIDTAPRNIQFEQATASDGESVTATSVRLILNTAHFEDVTVHYALTGTATGGGVDYTLASGDATIAAGGTSTTIPLTIIDDAIAETNETIVLTLSSPTNAVLGSNSLLTYTILDDDTSGVTVSKTTAAATEGGVTDTYTVVLTSEPTSTVSIILATNAQLTLSTSTLSFTSVNWSTPQTVTITATDDAAYEGAHSATITHTASSTDIGYNASTTIASILVSITDNDLPPSTGGGGGGAVGAGGSGTIPLFIPSFPTAIPLPPIVPAPSTTLLPSAQESLPAPVAPDASSTTPTPTSTVRTPSARILNLVRQDFRAFNVSVTPEVLRAEALFIQFGSDPITMSLGEGERRAIFRDLLDLQRRIPTIADHERLASGQIPLVRNLAQERRLLVRVRPTFRTIFGHDPRFADPTEARVWNTILYRLRIPRDLVQERAALLRFRTLFKRSPSDAFQWAVVRGLQGMGH